MIALVDEIAQPHPGLRDAIGRGDATEIEAERLRFCPDEIRQLAAAHILLLHHGIDDRSPADGVRGRVFPALYIGARASGGKEVQMRR